MTHTENGVFPAIAQPGCNTAIFQDTVRKQVYYSFVDHFSGWPEAFPVPDKCEDTVAHLVMEEIFPRYGCPLEIVTDNGTENENRVMREVLEKLKVHHVKTSFYHPQANAKVERFHRTLHDVLAKRIKDDVTSWDLYLNQALAAIRFNVSGASKFSPYFLLYSRDVVLPLDNILKPRRKYTGEDQHKIALQQQHKSFTLVHRHLKKAKRRQMAYANQNVKPVELEVGDPVYLKNHLRKNKLESRWKPYYRIIEKKSPQTFVIRNQLDGSTVKSHADHLRLAKIDELDIPVPDKIMRKTTYVVPPETESDQSDEDNSARERIVKRYRNERSDSDEEEDVPLMELARRLKSRKEGLQTNMGSGSSDDDQTVMSDMETDEIADSDGTDKMSVNEINSQEVKSDRKVSDVKQLLEALVGLL